MRMTQTAFAAKHRVSVNTVARWRTRGHVVLVDGLVDVEATELNLAKRVPWRRRDRRRADESSEDFVIRSVVDEGRAPYSIDEAHRIKENCLAMLRQIEVDKARGEVVLVSDVEQALLVEFQTVRSGVLSMPARMASRLVNISDPNKIKAMLDEAARETLEALCSKSQAVLDKAAAKRARGGRHDA